MAPNPEFPGIAWAGPASSGRSRAGLGPMRYITWHCTSNPTSNASGEAAFARNRTDGVGTHAVADATQCLQTQVTSLYLGHVGSSTGNRYGIAIECCGVNADSAAHWRPIIDQVAPFARAAMAKHGIANRWLTIAEMRDGRSTGHITHDMARLAWGATDHDDPGPNFPKDYVTSAIAGATAEAFMALSDQQQKDLWEWLALLVDPAAPATGRPGDRFRFPPPFKALIDRLGAVEGTLAASAQREQDMLTALTALAAGGGSIDTAAVLARIDQRSADVTGVLAQQSARIAELEAELEQARRARHAVAAAEADATADTPAG